ncbi:59_t:CDS:2 [Entrophospora sp. SA101]|nr:59_t:CDS:2 [Entrophospora sp. SA101]CAJ0916666.1 18936_t:CDS:2 [Entrophospora sp. SA101]
MSSSIEQDKAKERWKLLQSFILSSNSSSDEILGKVSKRNHQEFNLFTKQKLSINHDKTFFFEEGNEEWFAYDLFDNIVLNVFNKSICELGSGMSALAGLTIAAKCKPKSVTLTEGNPDLFCGPHRGNSLNTFIAQLNTINNFCVELLERYDETEEEGKDVGFKLCNLANGSLIIGSTPESTLRNRVADSPHVPISRPQSQSSLGSPSKTYYLSPLERKLIAERGFLKINAIMLQYKSSLQVVLFSNSND